ncbi:uncharacterized protein LOC129717901 isoform X2 [Wyeomyia smithii]|nr:uncharacterized protein LOC129717901 isoform X2 [Wyeomyia smithii]XP_055524149.1 uncharacterized protein LOC129717901 isoform X2 [Wyeomyia smithii]XP_055524150.1 uncharacterized protein LOC129717901 isoform X2 [Wyeomyia smithii]XP_055524151.1 uncharacterized protein LOC129717901 isoform X2 [Wyeomyia smithii]
MSSAFVVGSNGVHSSSNSSQRDANGELLKLALKKPKSWKWELTTSSSSPAISFPKIQLFDSRTGQLMVEVDRPDCVSKSEELPNGAGTGNDSSKNSLERKGRDQRYQRSQSMCIREKVNTSGEYLSDVFEQLQNKGLGHKLATSVHQYRVEDGEGEAQEEPSPLQKSKSVGEFRRSVSVDQVPTKKKVLRSVSSRSSSILGRISELYKSSTEEEPSPVAAPAPLPPPPTIPEINIPDEEPCPAAPAPTEPKPKIYKLVRSNAGTLMVREESFHTQRSLRRRRQEQLEAEEQRLLAPAEGRIMLQDFIPESYDSTLNEIDSLISKVMLSHTLPAADVDCRTEHRRRSMQNGSGGEQQSKKRRSRRSASAGSNASGYGSGRSRTSTIEQQREYSSSEEESILQAAETRFGSLKRRGRAKHRKNDAGSGERPQESNAHAPATAASCPAHAAGSKQPSPPSVQSSSSSLSTLSPPSAEESFRQSGPSPTSRASTAGAVVIESTSLLECGQHSGEPINVTALEDEVELSVAGGMILKQNSSHKIIQKEKISIDEDCSESHLKRESLSDESKKNSNGQVKQKEESLSDAIAAYSEVLESFYPKQQPKVEEQPNSTYDSRASRRRVRFSESPSYPALQSSTTRIHSPSWYSAPRPASIATSHSTSSLAFLRIQESLDSSKQLLQQQLQYQSPAAVVVQRRPQKTYARRSHRSSLILP